MAVSLAKQASSSTSATPHEVGAGSTIDLRVADAESERRHLRVQVQMARRRLDELESRSKGDSGLEVRLGDGLVEAQNQVARERADARLAVAALLTEADQESRRRIEVARDEARALLAVAEWLRSERRVSGAEAHQDLAMGLPDAGAAGA